MLVADCGFVLQLPHQHVDKVRVFDNDGNLFKHVLEANAGLLQTGDAEIEEVKKREGGCRKDKWHELQCIDFIQQYINVGKGQDGDAIGIPSN